MAINRGTASVFGKKSFVKGNTTYIFIGRPSRLGNPFTIGRDGSRVEVISKYRESVECKEVRNEFRNWWRDNRTENLKFICFCKVNESCHGDVLIEDMTPKSLFD